MKSHDYYRGREQTYIKHFFLEHYLERVAYNILSRRNEFVYVDGFSGPWKSVDEQFEDTSFVIAINKLRKIKKGFADSGRSIRIRCFFIENDRVAYSDLSRYVREISDIEVETKCQKFENLIPEITDFIGSSFSLVFIDPKGWSGYALAKVSPLLLLRGEIIINFMFNHINRFISDPRSETARSYNSLFGDPGWYDEYLEFMGQGYSREDAVLGVYKRRIQLAGKFPHITSTRIKWPLQERTYFHLVYATRHPKGLIEFREVERKAADEQERVRGAARLVQREAKTGTPDLFSANEAEVEVVSKTFENERRTNLAIADKLIRETVEGANEIKYEKLIGIVLEIPLVWESDIRAALQSLRGKSQIEIIGLRERERVPKRGNVIRWIG